MHRPIFLAVDITFNPLMGLPVNTIPQYDNSPISWAVGNLLVSRGDLCKAVIAMIQPQRITVVRTTGTVEYWIPNELHKYYVFNA